MYGHGNTRYFLYIPVGDKLWITKHPGITDSLFITSFPTKFNASSPRVDDPVSRGARLGVSINSSEYE